MRGRRMSGLRPDMYKDKDKHWNMTIIALWIIETNKNFVTLPFLNLKETVIFNHARRVRGRGVRGRGVGEGGEGEMGEGRGVRGRGGEGEGGLEHSLSCAIDWAC